MMKRVVLISLFLLPLTNVSHADLADEIAQYAVSEYSSDSSSYNQPSGEYKRNYVATATGNTSEERFRVSF